MKCSEFIWIKSNLDDSCGSSPWSIFLFFKKELWNLCNRQPWWPWLVQIPPALILRIALHACHSRLCSTASSHGTLLSCHHRWSFTHLPLPNWEKSSILKNQYICKHKTENSCVINQITTRNELKVKETRPLELAPNPKVSDLLIQWPFDVTHQHYSYIAVKHNTVGAHVWTKRTKAHICSS